MEGSSSTASLEKPAIELEPVVPKAPLAEQSVNPGAIVEKDKPRDAKRRRKVKANTPRAHASTASASTANASTASSFIGVERDCFEGYTDAERELMEAVECL